MINTKLTPGELEKVQTIKTLKSQAGTHSPSLFTIREAIPDLKLNIDACFLSNPYATDLFISYFRKELLNDDFALRDLLEFYPSQNKVIAALLESYLDISRDMIFIGNGAIEIIQAIIHSFTEEKILVNIPTFSSYYEFVRPSTRVFFNKLKKENQYKLVVNDLIEAVDREKPDTIVIINPNNPNGDYVLYDEMITLLEAFKSVKNVIIDESFIHFAYEDEERRLLSFMQLIHQYPNLYVIKSMSKDFGIAGIRAGYAVMHEDKVKQLIGNGYLWNSNGLAEYFFKLYVRSEFQNEYEVVRKKYIEQTENFFTELSKLDSISVFPSKANFALIELTNGMSSDDFAFGLLVKEGIYTRTGSDKIGLEGEFVRLASRTKEENDKIIESINNFIGA